MTGSKSSRMDSVDMGTPVSGILGVSTLPPTLLAFTMIYVN
jgi:hypothetical protein